MNAAASVKSERSLRFVSTMIVPKIDARIMPVPRSGCLSTSAIGSARIAAGMIKSLSVRPSVFGSLCRYLASAMMRKIFISSLGCSENAPIGIHL